MILNSWPNDLEFLSTSWPQDHDYSQAALWRTRRRRRVLVDVADGLSDETGQPSAHGPAIGLGAAGDRGRDVDRDITGPTTSTFTRLCSMS